MKQACERKSDAYAEAPRRKEVFDIVLYIIVETKVASLMDISCASGDFFTFSTGRFDGHGIDKSKELIDIALVRTRQPNCRPMAFLPGASTNYIGTRNMRL